ncbi:MAG TPA: dockerin type I domain-containing protein, partial [Pirellulales bacterium]|nr:dockerin type I domain-containing protein [Pirellulales bacterium]
AAGAAVAAPPTDFAISFSSPYAPPPTIVASALAVNGIAADSYTLTDATTITFHFNVSPVTAQGLQTMAIAAGSFTRQADGAPLSAYSASFRYDVTPIGIDATTPTNQSIVTVPLNSLTVHFNEAFAAATIGTTNLTISQGSVSGFSIIDSQTVQYALAGVNSPGTLSISMAAGSVTDVYGNPGSAYSGTIFLNGTTTAFPIPLAQVKPAGSLVYQGSVAGSILFAGNTVSYSLAVAAGQTLSLSVAPAGALQPQISVVGQGVNSTASSPSAGAAAAMQSIPIAGGGTYIFTVSGLNGTTGSYKLTTYLNAFVSTSTSANGNHSQATAQSIDGGFVTLAGSSQRTAVVSPSAAVAGPNNFGYAAIAVPSQFDDITASGTQIALLSPTANLPTQLGPTLPSGISFPFYGTTYNTLFVNPHGVIEMTRSSVNGTNTDLSSAPFTAIVAPFWDNVTVSGAPDSAAYYKLEPTATGNRLVIEWYHVSFIGGPQTGQVTFEAMLGSDGTILFNYLNVDPSLTRAGDPGPTIGIKNLNTPGADPLVVASPTLSNSLISSGTSIEIGPSVLPAVSDYYAFTLGGGQTATAAVAALNSAAVHVTLLDGGGNVVAAGSSPGSGSSIAEAINNFSGPAGTYYVLVTGAPGAAYSLTVTRNAALAAGNNVSFATAQDITATRGALGAITLSAAENWYSINLAAGTLLRLQTYTPGGSASQFVNSFDPAIELYDPSDVLIASGQGNRNQSLVTTVSADATYRIRVHSADATMGEYFLSAATGPIPPEIAGVYVSGGAAWSQAFYTYLAGHGLGDSQLGYAVGGGASQLFPLPWNDMTTVSVAFTQDVTIKAAAAGLALVGSPDLPAAPSLSAASFNYNSTTHTATWTFSALLADDKYLLSIPSSAVVNSTGQSLDGDWATGSSAFPSGDGAPGGDFAFRFNVLAADVDQNGVVTGVDGNAIRNRLLADTTSSNYSPLLDVNGDGAITSQDGSLVRMHLLDALPATDPALPGGGSAVAMVTAVGRGSEDEGRRSDAGIQMPVTGLLATGQSVVSGSQVTLVTAVAASETPPAKSRIVAASVSGSISRSVILPRRMVRATDVAARDSLFELLGST